MKKMTTFAIGELPSKMKSLFSILGLTFLSLTLTNCSLSPEQIASRLEPSVVLLSYKNKPGHGTGFFVAGEPGVCRVLTSAHVVNKEGNIRLRTEKDGKFWDVARVEIFPNTIDLALVTFEPDTERCNYPALTIGNSESLRKGSSIFIYGFPSRGGKLIGQFVDGQVSALKNLARGYGVSYRTLTVGGMSGAPVMNERGKVVAVHGMSDREIVKTLALQKIGLSESEQQLNEQAEESLRTASIQRFTFSWGVPIAFFRESKFYYPQLSELSLWLLFSVGAFFGGGIVYFGLRYFQTPQVSGQRQRELERQLRDEQRRRQQVEGRLSSLQNQRTQAQQELERQLRDEQGRGQELEGRLSSLQNQRTQAQQELERQLEWERGKRREVEAQLQRQGQVKSGQMESESVAKTRQRELERQLEWERVKRREVEAQLQRQGQVQSPVREPQSSDDVPLVSAVGVDYTKLRDLLVAKDWKEADLETDKRMLEVAGRESQGWLRVEDVENFPCQDLGTIDKLWVKYSGGKFGFSVQKQIYQDLGGTKDYDEKVWESFGDKVGWRKGGSWLSYSNLTFSQGHYMGHLPSLGFVVRSSPLSDSSLAQRLIDCNI